MTFILRLVSKFLSFVFLGFHKCSKPLTIKIRKLEGRMSDDFLNFKHFGFGNLKRLICGINSLSPNFDKRPLEQRKRQSKILIFRKQVMALW